ncbi:MAG: shikimate kinase [Treponema sp.]|jgi:shikimate kinase|nr:shikimate kinase [Treponema sp.]
METLLLTGPKHSGKTSAGRMLAALSGAVFIDLDERIEKRTGKGPRTLYREGPEVFRAAEAETLKELLEAPAEKGSFRVIAAGGGLIDNPAALELVKKTCPVCIVYLEVSAETAWERIVRGTGEKGELPPFLDTPNPRETHRALHERRAAAYKKLARFVVNGECREPGERAEEIISLLAPKKSPLPPSR